MAEGAAAGCVVVQYSPNQVKDAVAGYGGADKLQVQRMVQTLLGLASLPEPPDAADAAAIALTHLALAGPLTQSPVDAPSLALTGAASRPAGRGRVKNAVARPQPARDQPSARDRAPARTQPGAPTR
jgi:hypothetical protein